MTVGARIRQTRGKLSRDEFSSLIEIHPQTLYLYEKNKRTPSLELIQEICKAYRVSVEWLTCGKGSMRPGEAQQPAEKTPEPPANTPKTAGCTRCAKMEAELEKEREERRELSRELREVNAENRRLARENGDLKAKCAVLEERQKHCCPEPQVFEKIPNIPSSKTDLRA